MRRVACIVVSSSYPTYDYSEDYTREFIASHLTNFVEVDDETFELLKQAEHRHDRFNFLLIEQLPDSFIPKTIEDITRVLAKEKKERERATADAAEKKRLKELKRLANIESKKQDRVNQLREELARLEGSPDLV